jgi:hypothetical protein
MFKGIAELRSPETNARLAVLTETCLGDGTTHARVQLDPPITLSGTENLAIFSTVGWVIGVGARDGGPTEIREFHGESASDCIPDKGDVTLVRSPGGPLSSLDIVLARGTVREEF